ncbi:GNAT family N-acetyltransferase [uncultured Kriegella sp.]|uniref:GNAT family N-acetyltransferase n=1 Tax=uncultured Kriegella sp. TaxID=1798910 RepID=UPI0030DDC225|tara:strand:- start:100269 stop:100721 length:453 start_codon:yes stop_codon:yes gene_type:complete
MNIRPVTEKDLPAIVEMLANDKLGRLREDFQTPLPKVYYKAFERIVADKNQELLTVENEDQEPIATFQLSFIPYLTYQGGIRCQVENVRVRDDYTRKGIGKQMFEWIVARAKQKGAHVIQLTSDKQRPDAIRFYENIGFSATHEGLKLHL